MIRIMMIVICPPGNKASMVQPTPYEDQGNIIFGIFLDMSIA